MAMNGALERFFPKRADNGYAGHRLAAWMLVLYAVKSLVSAAIHMFAADGGAQSIASVALDRFTAEGADSVITMFGLWGLEQLVVGLIAVAVLLRYRSLIPMMSLAYVIEYAGRMASPLYTPGLATVHAPPGATADKLLLPLALIMLALSLLRPKGKRHAATA